VLRGHNQPLQQNLVAVQLFAKNGIDLEQIKHDNLKWNRNHEEKDGQELSSKIKVVYRSEASLIVFDFGNLTNECRNFITILETQGIRANNQTIKLAKSPSIIVETFYETNLNVASKDNNVKRKIETTSTSGQPVKKFEELKNSCY